jgi:hypothetical protein
MNKQLMFQKGKDPRECDAFDFYMEVIIDTSTA